MTTSTLYRSIVLIPRGQRYADLMRLSDDALAAMAATYTHIGLWARNPCLLDRSELISALVAAEERGAS